MHHLGRQLQPPGLQQEQKRDTMTGHTPRRVGQQRERHNQRKNEKKKQEPLSFMMAADPSQPQLQVALRPMEDRSEPSDTSTPPSCPPAERVAASPLHCTIRVTGVTVTQVVPCTAKSWLNTSHASTPLSETATRQSAWPRQTPCRGELSTANQTGTLTG